MDSKEANAVTARAMVKAVDELKTVPTVLVSIYNGIIEEVAADRPYRVLILEYDQSLNLRDYDGDDIVLWDDRPALLQEWCVPREGVDPGLSAKIQQAKDCPRCENCGHPVPGGDYCYKENSFAKLCEECAGDDNVLVND
ncbi:MAG: hypothetical protein FJ128_14695 [Deltaproteobacteria bacterium]|nr:hypothetical protein [Deltaproteobacteria bacterium]MBM4289729.1 hypothetical protein [Deltaproteobacteria bacterium]